jgi:sarcosine oxidase
LTVSQEVRPAAGPFPSRSRWDVIVVGCGVMGAAVTYNLAKKGLRVINIERFGVNHDHGSSHGQTRIIRLAYYEDPRYVPLLRRAFVAWRGVESQSGRRLLKMTGGLMIGRPGGELVEGVLRSAKAHGIPHEILTAKETRERFQAFKPGEEFSAVFEENAGVLFAEDCVRALVGLGSEAGGEFRFSEEVKTWRSGPERIEVETSMGRQAAEKLVVCAGAWNSKLLNGLIPLQIERQVPFWFSSGGLERFVASKMPVFIMEEEKDVFYYGIPDVGHGVKVARSHGGETVDPDGVRREVGEKDVFPVLSFNARRMNGLGGPPIASTACLYSNTPDMNFVVGPHPADSRVTVVSACSGHGFKFASVIGEIVADQATGKKVEFDISFMSPDRFGQRRQG